MEILVITIMLAFAFAGGFILNRARKRARYQEEVAARLARCAGREARWRWSGRSTGPT